jgi:hypothetical protein
MVDPKGTCFIAMPITTHVDEAKNYGDSEHWNHVMEHLFVPAIEAAGYQALRPVAEGSDLIHEKIIQQLEQADLVLCDLSSHNPNVFFELGIRTSLDKPVALVRDEHTTLPFDTSGLNTHSYGSALVPWDLPNQVTVLATHIERSVATCEGHNPLWRKFGLTLRAQEPIASESPEGARLNLLVSKVDELVNGLRTGELNPERASQRLDRENLQRWFDQAALPAADWSEDVRRSNELLGALLHTPLMEGVHITPRQVGNVVYIGLSAEEPPPGVKERIFELAAHYGVPIRFEYVPLPSPAL